MNWYDAIADGYDELRGEEQRSKLREFKPFLEPGMRVLDVGFGTGISDDILPTEIIGVEPNKAMLESYHGDTTVYEGRGEEVDELFDTDSFDAVLCVSTAHHFEDVDTVFQNIRGVLRPQGYLFISIFKDESQVLETPALNGFNEKNRCRVHRDITVTYQLRD